MNKIQLFIDADVVQRATDLKLEGVNIRDPARRIELLALLGLALCASKVTPEQLHGILSERQRIVGVTTEPVSDSSA